MEKLTMTDADFSNLARILRKVDFFAPMTIGQLESVLPYIMLCRYSKGESVFKQGESGDAFYIIYEGKVSVSVKKGFFSFAKQVASLKSGDFFGEMALLSKDARSATVACEEDSRLFVLLSTDFQSVVMQNPSFAAEVGKIAERRKFMSSHQE